MKKPIEKNVQDVKASIRSGHDSAKAQGDLTANAHRAWSALLRLHASGVERIEKRISTSGDLSIEGYDVLLTLSYAPNGRLRMGELFELVTLSRSGLTRLMDRLEKKGWVRREVCPDDRRSFEAILTPEGEAARAGAWPSYAQAIASEFGRYYSDEEARQLAALLERPLEESK